MILQEDNILYLLTWLEISRQISVFNIVLDDSFSLS